MEFVVIRYVPAGAREMTVGLVLFEKLSGGDVGFIKARFTQNMQKILDLDPDADIDMLRLTFEELERDLNSTVRKQETLSMIQDSFSNALKVSNAKAIVVKGDAEAEFETLAALYLPETSSKS